MKSNNLFIYLAVIGIGILVSCEIHKDDKMEYKIPDFAQNQTEFTDEELLNATYSGYKLPLDFYFENLEGANLYYVNTLSVDSLVDEKRFELSTNSLEQAKNWSIKSTYEKSQFEQGLESEKFFEFIRTKNQIYNHSIKFRTHKLSYLTRDNYEYDYLNKSGTIGVFQKQNFKDDEVKELIDYLWFIQYYNNESHKVLSSFIVNNQHTMEVHHYELYIVHGDFNIYDEIILLKKVYEIEKKSGVIKFFETKIREINGEFN
ncbi:hypothetical protein MASR2M47_28540 [Draconibacterium sp.]